MINVTCAIILIEDKILATKRSEQMKMPLKWEFPGGKLEKNEEETACIKREIKEELNIDIEVTKRLTPSVFDYGDFEINLIPFLARHLSGEILLKEHSEYRLLDKNELSGLDWAEADVAIVNEVLKIEL